MKSPETIHWIITRGEWEICSWSLNKLYCPWNNNNKFGSIMSCRIMLVKKFLLLPMGKRPIARSLEECNAVFVGASWVRYFNHTCSKTKYRFHNLTFFKKCLFCQCLIWKIIIFIVPLNGVVPTLEHLLEILRHYFKNHGDVAECWCFFCPKA